MTTCDLLAQCDGAFGLLPQRACVPVCRLLCVHFVHGGDLRVGPDLPAGPQAAGAAVLVREGRDAKLGQARVFKREKIDFSLH